MFHFPLLLLYLRLAVVRMLEGHTMWNVFLISLCDTFKLSLIQHRIDKLPCHSFLLFISALMYNYSDVQFGGIFVINCCWLLSYLCVLLHSDACGLQWFLRLRLTYKNERGCALIAQNETKTRLEHGWRKKSQNWGRRLVLF